LNTLSNQGFSFLTFEKSLICQQLKSIILRHDVDLLPYNSLRFAQIQAELGISGSYYFRFVPGSYNETVIREVFSLGHEIGYHYETLDTCSGNIDQAYSFFCENLEKLRKLVPVTTICMHGSPLSKYDNRLIWQKYDYQKLGLIGEPYFDVDFNKVLYLTDTGRRWDGDSYNVRDKSIIRKAPKRDIPITDYRSQITNYRLPFPKFHTTFDIIKTAMENKLPDHIMMTFHPQRWTDRPLPWVKELVWQNAKNLVKYFVVKANSDMR
jgi:hypothetical protein